MERIFRNAGRVPAALLFLFSLTTVAAQEPAPTASSAPTPSDPTAAAPAAVVETPPAIVAAEPAAPAPTRAVLLPVEFSVYEKGMGGGELVADWTEAARANLGAAVVDVLNERAGLQLVPMPELTAQEQQVLREHLALVKLMVIQANGLSNGVWISRKLDFDRRFGDGLRFLCEKSGADLAIVIEGSQVKQSGGGVFAQIAMATLGVAMPGGGTYLTASLLDVKNGELKWFNAKFGVEIAGITGSDIRAPEEAKVTLRKLFEPYPKIPAL